MRRLVLIFLFSLSLSAQEVDLSACRAMYDVLQSMHEGASRADVEKQLDVLLETRPYRVMFAHYNRSWRPNHLPKDVFKRMLLSLRFEDAYRSGENERADAMRAEFAKFYADLPSLEKKVKQFESVDLATLLRDGVRYAQSWLPPDWKIPDFYFVILPSGGSPGFTIDGSQGYDLLQLPIDAQGRIDLEWLVATIAHESHHLGMALEAPESLEPSHKAAFLLLSIPVGEGTATKFVSGAPSGCSPNIARYNTMKRDPQLIAAWNEHESHLAGILQHQTEQLDRALAGKLSLEELEKDLRDYWLSGNIGRAYVLGATLFGAIHTAFGKEGVFDAMKDPRKLFALYNAALEAKPKELARCPRVPEKAVKQAESIGKQ